MPRRFQHTIERCLHCNNTIWSSTKVKQWQPGDADDYEEARRWVKPKKKIVGIGDQTRCHHCIIHRLYVERLRDLNLETAAQRDQRLANLARAIRGLPPLDQQPPTEPEPTKDAGEELLQLLQRHSANGTLVVDVIGKGGTWPTVEPPTRNGEKTTVVQATTNTTREDDNAHHKGPAMKTDAAPTPPARESRPSHKRPAEDTATPSRKRRRVDSDSDSQDAAGAVGAVRTR